MAPVRVSVIVPTYKRPESLRHCLDALRRQDTQADEILVVARRDDAPSLQVITEYTGGCVVAVLIDVPAGSPGLVTAMNAGAAASSGDIVCLTDDDAAPHADWITRIVAAFADDASVGAAGGRDFVYHDGKPELGSAAVVGSVSWYGRVVGNHHLGVGSARDVTVLKGVNLSVRGDVLRRIGFDTRLRGTSTEHHWEIGLCLRVARMGYRVIYDPAIAVDHTPQPRVDEAREFRPHQVRDSAHNETLALLEHLGSVGSVVHLLLTVVVGTHDQPGLARATRRLGWNHEPSVRNVAANIRGRYLALATYMRSRQRAVVTAPVLPRLPDRREDA
jgi:GT2 family glycosyltransferase